MSQPIVIDNGSGSIKIGFAGGEAPEKVFPNIVGRPNGSSDGEPLLGDKATEYKDRLKMTYPMEHGIVNNWDDMEKIWQYGLKSISAKGKNVVLLTEAANNPQCNKGKAAEIFFEKFDAPAFYVQIQAILSLYAGGRMTGVVLDSGDGVTSAVPIYEGYAIKSAIQRSNVAGRDVTKYLQMLLRKGGYNFHSSMDMEVVKRIKETRCYLSLDIEKDEEDYREFEPVQFQLPDNKLITIGPEKFRAPELLFDTIPMGQECDGIQDCLYNAIAESDMDIRKTLCTNITCAGGSTKIANFGDRLLSELEKMFPSTKIKVYIPHSRLTSAWVGGSILAGLPTFKKMWVTKKEYKESGRRAVYQKCRY